MKSLKIKKLMGDSDYDLTEETIFNFLMIRTI
jgi:hypothetical protein